MSLSLAFLWLSTLPPAPPSCLSLGFFIIPVSWFRRGSFSALLTLLFLCFWKEEDFCTGSGNFAILGYHLWFLVCFLFLGCDGMGEMERETIVIMSEVAVLF